MTLRLTNTLSGEPEPFEPQDPEEVLLYYCGLTVSDPPHLGHARSWVHVDVLHRWLEHLGYGVRHVENVTDVNEKIVARIGTPERGDTEAAVARSYLAETIEAMRSLNLLRAAVYPRVTEHVPEIVDLVETLVDRGYAYESGGSVYFDVTSFEDYGRLSNQDLDEIEAQGDPDERAEKRHPADFALWKADGVSPGDIEEHRHEDAAPPETACEGAQTWDSPWGEGRPGWHVECSAMSMAHLGETLDVHAGGRDLVFPHHENEIAQSEAATGQPFARHWMHCALFEMDEEKMSSSLGNFVTVGEAVQRWGVNTLRTFLTAASYNSAQVFSEAAIAEAGERWERLERAHERATDALDSPDAGTKVTDEALHETVESSRAAFRAAMNDDLNTREAQTALLEIAGAIHRHVAGEAPYDYVGLRRSVETLEQLGGILGLSFDGPGTGEVELADDLVELVLEVRAAEREAGNYERADELRAALAEMGVEVNDTADGPEYRLPSR